MADQRLERIIERCRGQGMRRTRLLARLLGILLTDEGPVAVKTLSEHPEIGGQCDPATLYRLLARLQAAGIIRRIGLHERAAYYELVSEDCSDHYDYVVCTQCGRLEALDMHCPVEAMEGEVARRTGYRHLHHELQYYGVCPQCTK